MLKGENIICVALPSWESNYMKTIVEMMSVLARDHKVLYVNNPPTYKNIWQEKRWSALGSSLETIFLKEGGQVHVLHPSPVLPINWLKQEGLYQTLLAQNARVLARNIRGAMRELEMANPIVINAFNPFYGKHLAGKLDEKHLLYYCYDEISAAPWCQAHGAKAEADFIPLTDLVITSSQALLERKQMLHPHTFLVENGVNFSLFHQAFHLKKNKHQAQKTTIGYLGSLDDRLDYALLAHCIQQLPNCQFSFVGRVQSQVGRRILKAYPNVKLWGAKSPAELPNYLKDFDVGLIPFVKNEFTRNIYPLKINEYLAAGIPVVATDFAPLDAFDDLVYVASDAHEFLVGVRSGLEPEEASRVATRVEMARSNAWEQRAGKLSDILESRLLYEKVV